VRVLAQSCRFAQNRIYHSPRVPKRIFSYEQAVALLPEVLRITSEAVERVEQSISEEPADYERIVTEWAESILDMGVEVKGLWLVDFDSGGGYYCWKHPEPALEYFHGYEEGFGGRVKLN
jgi:hypothetical protein